MPLFTDAQAIKGTNYGFSAVRIEDLGATEYTLALVALDVSGSTGGFRQEMEQALKEIVKACRRSPRADNMMLRVIKFSAGLTEVHGFKPLPDCSEDSYTGCLGTGGGMTALFDATYNGVQAATQYGAQLSAKDFDVNAVVFVITDGMDNASGATPSLIKAALVKGVKDEALESMNSILIGLGGQVDPQLKDQCGFTQYVAVAEATEKTLAKLGAFISQSISSTSQALGSGGPSQSLAF